MIGYHGYISDAAITSGLWILADQSSTTESSAIDAHVIMHVHDQFEVSCTGDVQQPGTLCNAKDHVREVLPAAHLSSMFY